MKVSSSRLLNIGLVTILVVSVFMGAAISTTGQSDPEVRWALQLDICRSGLLLQLPFGATGFPYGRPYGVSSSNILHWLDVDHDTPGNQQSISVLTGTTITVTCEFQTWHHGSGVLIRQNFFIFSWTPSWPPPEGYYYPFYDDNPGTYPGHRESFSFNLTVPDEEGVYYLYYCYGKKIYMEDAVNLFKQPLWVPYAVIVVGPP